MASLGTLTLDLIAKIGGFEQGLDQASRVSKRKAKEIADAQKKAAKDAEKAWEGVGTAIKAGFAGITISATIGKFIQETVNAQNEQAQLAAVLKSTGQAAGYSADQLNKMAGKLSGESVFSDGDINQAQTRLLAFTNVVGKQFPEAMQAAIDMAARLGMPVTQAAEMVGKALDVPSQGLTALTKQGFRFTEEQKKLIESLENTGRTAEAQEIILKGLNEAYGGAAKAARDTLGGSLAALKNQINQLMQGDDGSFAGAKDAVNELTATLGSNETRQAFASIAESIAGLVAQLAKASTEFISFGKFVGESLAQSIHGSADPIDRIDEQIDGLRLTVSNLNKELDSGSFTKWLAGTDESKVKQKLAATEKQITDLLAMRQQLVNGASNPSAPNTAAPGVLPKPIGIKHENKDDPTKKLLDNELKTWQRFIEDQRDLLSQRNKFLDMFNAQGLISVRDYYDQQRNIIDEATKEQVAAYDTQIDALRKYQASATKETDRVEAQGKENDLLAKKAKLLRDSGAATIELGIKEQQSHKETANAIRDVNAQLLELQGNLGAAAAIRFDASHEKLLNMFSAEGNTDAVNAVKQLRSYTIAQADFNKEATSAGEVLGYLQIAEDRIGISRQLGAIGELDALKSLGEARQTAVRQMEGIVAAQDAIAKASGNPALILNAEKARVALEQLKATADPVADKFNEIFSDSFADAFAGFIQGTKTAQQAFASFASSVVSQLARIAAQEMASSIFGKSGGGIGGLLGTIFGGFGGSSASAFDTLGVGLPSFDVGSPYVPNDMIAKIHKGERILTADENRQFSQGGGSPTIIVHVNGTSAPDVRRAAGQGAREALQAFEGAKRYA